MCTISTFVSAFKTFFAALPHEEALRGPTAIEFRAGTCRILNLSVSVSAAATELQTRQPIMSTASELEKSRTISLPLGHIQHQPVQSLLQFTPSSMHDTTSITPNLPGRLS
jgi:hypothetical protein